MPGAAAWGSMALLLLVLNFLFCLLPVRFLVPEIKEVVSHKYKTPMVSVPAQGSLGIFGQLWGGPSESRG